MTKVTVIFTWAIKTIRIIWFLIISLTAYNGCIAQSAIRLDSLLLTTRNIQPAHEDIPASVADPQRYKRDVELNVAFYLNDTTTLDSLEIKYGATPGASDIFDLKFVYMKIDQRYYFVSDGMKFPIYGKFRVYITYLIQEYTLLEPDHVWIRAKDKQGKYTNILTDIN